VDCKVNLIDWKNMSSGMLFAKYSMSSSCPCRCKLACSRIDARKLQKKILNLNQKKNMKLKLSLAEEITKEPYSIESSGKAMMIKPGNLLKI